MRSATCKKPNNSFFDQLVNDLFAGTELTPTAPNRPKANIIKHGESWEIQLAIPGYTKKDISLNIEDQTIFLSGKINSESKDELEYKRREFDLSSWKRSFKLGNKVDVESINAQMKNGILTIKLPKKEELAKREINIK